MLSTIFDRLVIFHGEDGFTQKIIRFHPDKLRPFSNDRPKVEESRDRSIPGLSHRGQCYGIRYNSVPSNDFKDSLFCMFSMVRIR